MRLVCRIAAVAAAISPHFVPAAASARLEIIPPEVVLARHVVLGESGTAKLVIDGRSWELITDPDDEILSPLGDGSFHPMDASVVAEAVASIRASHQLPEGRVFILPFPRRDVPESSCEGSLVFLAPGILPVHPVHVHATVTHEIGHVFQHAFCPDGSPAWREYVELRGLDPSRFHETAAHRDRPREIFAEDFRVLRGGGVAAAAGAIENPSLEHPSDVEGLEAYFARLARRPSAAALVGPRGSAAPNPFRAVRDGTVAIRFASPVPEASCTPVARVLDVAGRCIRTLRAESPDGVLFRWNGADGGGTRVATGVYFVARDGDPGTPVRVQILR